MTKAILLDAFGGVEHMRVADVDVPPPGKGEALVRQTVMGVNFSDVLARRGIGLPVTAFAHDPKKALAEFARKFKELKVDAVISGMAC